MVEHILADSRVVSELPQPLQLANRSITLVSMNNNLMHRLVALAGVLIVLTSITSWGEEPSLPKAMIDGTGLGWEELTLDSFEKVNCDDDTWTASDGVIHCTGKPVGVIKSKQPYTNFELVAEWQHKQSGGNSGIFVWASAEGLQGLKPNQLPPIGIEVQVLDHGYAEQYEKSQGKKPDWFTTNGDVFPVAKSNMKPFPPIAPDKRRSFPRKNLSKGINNWNHYYVRAINGEVRLWVNGEEVSGGTECDPKTGFLCLESEGAPIDFRNLRIRVLP